ncbi:hypothetical protein HPB47_008068 [Ixodes persulcatus]|uniref:Uncharacterized protein n=1 Tax=Ixodes persulcatus TaxID=34615 RepID=A0AC60P5X1_IXOPE|nr:hypothetical protein HPB47_008068 [Ixodes persulcatus]
MSVPRTELLALLLLLASGLCPAYRTGFDADACESLCPVPGCPTNTSAKDAGPKLSDRGFPLSGSFQFSPKMRRTTPFRGVEFLGRRQSSKAALISLQGSLTRNASPP